MALFLKHQITGSATLALERDLKGSLKGDIDIDIEVEVAARQS